MTPFRLAGSAGVYLRAGDPNAVCLPSSNPSRSGTAGGGVRPGELVRPVVGRVDHDGVLRDAEVVEGLEELADVLVVLPHAVGVFVALHPDLALEFRPNMREDVHAGRVHPGEERLLGLDLTVPPLATAYTRTARGSLEAEMAPPASTSPTRRRNCGRQGREGRGPCFRRRSLPRIAGVEQVRTTRVPAEAMHRSSRDGRGRLRVPG